ncbi:LCP family protein [Gloeocapsa sp. PCC 73106]|uniref:LCP family protein n=1 Tax=Gloeocapsa sp. PCC 73106 TaxID=102232 RepID=UPI001EE65EAD|nr:LCP family protein [Gloeocapsa sp. PCC 73106]
MAKTKTKRSRTRWLLISLAMSAIALLSATAGALLAVSLYEQKPLQKAQLTPEEQSVFRGSKTVGRVAQLERPINIIVLGVKVLTSDLEEPSSRDLGYHALVDSFDGVSDTILLLRFNPQTEKLTVLSIPRDTKTYIPGYGIDKINAANDEGGSALAAQTISDLLGGIAIDRYIRINVQGVEKLIDALGGVTLYVPKDMKYTDESQHLYIDLKQGTQHLDGDKALDYIRFRYDNYGDIGRIQRQQMLLRAIVDKAVNPEVIFKSPQIFSIIQGHIDTNLSVEELLALSAFASKTKGINVEMLMLPGEFNGDGKTEVSYWLPHHQKIANLMGEHFDVGYRQADYNLPENLSVAIQDSTNDPEAVGALVLRLQHAGYQKVYVSRDWGEQLQQTRIIAQMGDDVSAIALRAELGFGEVLVESTGIIGSDITIILGEDWSKHNE